MSWRTRRMALTASLLVGSASAALGADLYGPGYEPEGRSDYDDRRYGEMYDHPEPRWRRSRHAERLVGPPPYEHPSRHRYLKPMPGVPDFDDERRRSYSSRFGHDECVGRREILRVLMEDGWSEIADVEAAGPTVHVVARRASGQLYRLQVDRCSGTLIEARLIDGFPGAFAGEPFLPHARPRSRY